MRLFRLSCLAGILLLLSCRSVRAGTSAAAAGAGGITTVLDDPGSLCAGVAGIADAAGHAAGLSYHDLYGLSPLAVKQAFLITALQPAAAARHWTAAAEVEHTGYAPWHETHAGVMLAGKLDAHIRAGARWDLIHVAAAEGHRATHVLGAIGLRMKWSERQTIGIIVSNLTLANRQRLPETVRAVHIRAGYSVRLASNAVTCLEWFREDTTCEWQSWRFGFLFLPVERIVLRCGLYCRPRPSVSIGCGFRIRQWETDFAATSHPLLGNRISLSICKSWE